MSHRKPVFWLVTCLLCLGMLLGGVAQILQLKFNVDGITHLGFPRYVLPIFGVWKILAACAILAPKRPLLKEWAYAGLFFLLSGGVISHLASGDGLGETTPVAVFTILTLMSWHLRPGDRRLSP